MKRNSIFSQTKAMIAIGVSAGLLLATPYVAGAMNPKALVRTNNPGEEEEPAKKSKTTRTASTSRNNSVIKIYPDVVKRSMHVIAKDAESKELDFYVFDMQGTLIQHFKMKQRDHLKIGGLARGKYVYRVFKGDEETATGNFEIK